MSCGTLGGVDDGDLLNFNAAFFFPGRLFEGRTVHTLGVGCGLIVISYRGFHRLDTAYRFCGIFLYLL